MADLVITAANVAAGSTARTAHGTAGVAISPGQATYRDPDDNLIKLADCDNADADVRGLFGIALNSAAAGQPVTVAQRGPVTIGAAVVAGVGYYLSATPGGICPVADLGAGDYPLLIGFAINATDIDIDPATGAAALA
jgi:hypothetical protein